MIIGIPKELKDKENRVGIVPSGVRALARASHTVLIQKGAGFGSGISDEDYKKEGAKIVDTNKEIWANAEMVMKVKEPIQEEFELLGRDQIVYTYFHLAACHELGEVLVKRGVTAVAYETIQLSDGSLPLLKPMSEVAGKMSVQVGAFYLQKNNGGKGVLLGGIPGVKRGTVAIVGAGIVGMNAAKMAIGLGAEVIVFDIDLEKLSYLDDVFGSKIITIMSNETNIEKVLPYSDLVVGAVLLAGAKAPKLITKKMISSMEEGSVFVDVAIDQGGCSETSKPTSHTNPTYLVDGVIHYCVTNIPGIVARTSAYGLTNTTLPYALKMANLGFTKAVKADNALRLGVNTYGEKVRHEAVARAMEMDYVPLEF